MKTLILARHAHAVSNVGDTINAVPPGEGLSLRGIEEARALGLTLATEPIDLGIGSRLARTQQTLAVALEGRRTPLSVEPLLDEIDFGAFEGGTLASYREWAWEQPPDADCPGGGESRVDAAIRFADGLESLLDAPAATVLAVSHALLIRYVLGAAEGTLPAARVESVPHAVPFRLERPSVQAAVASLRAWAGAPRFADTPIGG